MSSKEQLLKKAYDLAYKYEAEMGSCPQCVLSAVYETLGIIDESLIKASDGLAGGTSLSTKGTCGALIGGILAISSIVGREYQEFKENKKKRIVFKYTKKLYDKFIEEYGSPVCCDLHKKLFGRTFDLLDPKDYEEFEKAGAHIDKCPSVSGNVAKWTVDIIINELKKKIK